MCTCEMFTPRAQYDIGWNIQSPLWSNTCRCVCVQLVVSVQRLCLMNQCRRKSVVCPSTRTGTAEVLVGSYDSALQHSGRNKPERASEREGGFEAEPVVSVCHLLVFFSSSPASD